MLFEGRMGHMVYRPIGREWYDEGFWKIYDHPSTIEQYLGIGGATPDGTPPLNDIAGVVGGLYLCNDIDSGKTNRAITLESFKSMPFDIVIASIPQHIEPFRELIRKYKPEAKLIFQVGNSWSVDANSVKNVMASAIVPNVLPGINFVSYHQEFDTKVFRPGGTFQDKDIYSFVNCFNTAEIFKEDWELFTQMESLMPEWNFRAFGGQCRDGSKNGSNQLAGAMRTCRFAWHTKKNGDGFGHVLHNLGSIGKPFIIKAEYYRGKMAEPFIIDGETCLAIDSLSIEEIKNKIEYFSDNDRYLKLTNNLIRKFKETVDFDKDEEKVKDFLAHLL